MQAVSYSALPSPYELLRMAWDDVVACANAVGIDGHALRYTMPAHGQRLSGLHVPVLESRYRHACSVMLYINPLPGGGAWPFVRFFTFKDGGQYSDFNGLRWWRQFGQHNAEKKQGMPVFCEAPELARERVETADNERRQRFVRWNKRWQQAETVNCQHTWITQRLIGLAGPDLLRRIALREPRKFSGNTVIAPLERVDSSDVIGYQLIFYSGRTREHEQKRILIPEAGASQGAFIRLGAQADGKSLPVALCEGLATGLSIALAWPGEIRVALNAYNLKAVRQGIKGPVVIFRDDDRWKPAAGNTGERAAEAARLTGDSVYAPVFSDMALTAQPTDFNDLLYLEGMASLYEQISHVRQWHEPY